MGKLPMRSVKKNLSLRYSARVLAVSGVIVLGCESLGLATLSSAFPIMNALLFVTVLGTILAWWLEGVGGALVSMSGVASLLLLTMFQETTVFNSGIISGSFLMIAGAFFLGCWWSSEDMKWWFGPSTNDMMQGQ